MIINHGHMMIMNIHVHGQWHKVATTSSHSKDVSYPRLLGQKIHNTKLIKEVGVG